MPSYSTPSTNLSTGLSTKPTRLTPDYLAKTQNFVPLSVFFAGTKEPEADPDSLFGLRMPPREKKKPTPPKEKKAKGGSTSSAKDDKGKDDDEKKDEKGAQKGPQSPVRSQTSQPRPQQTPQAQAPQQGAQGAAGAKQESRLKDPNVSSDELEDWEWDIDDALREISGAIRAWIHRPETQGKGALAREYKALTPDLKYAIAKDVERVVKMHHGGTTFVAYRMLRGGSEVLKGLDSVTTNLKWVSGLDPKDWRKYRIRASDVLVHWGQETPLAKSGFQHEQEIILKPGVSIRPMKSGMAESLARLLDVAKGQSVAHSEMTTTANVPTLPVPIGAGDGRKFLDRPDDDKQKKKKKRRKLSRSLYMLLRQ